MVIRVPKVQAPSAFLPLAFLFHCDSSCLKPRFPVGQFVRWDSERDVQFSVAVVRRLDRARSSLLEQQQHLACTCVTRAATLAKLADDAKPKGLLVKAN